MTFYAKPFDRLSAAEVYEILKARAAVFMMEQKIHYLDMDDIDYQSLHCFIIDEGKVVAYLRAFADEEHPQCVQIGRVLSLPHGIGLGKALMEQSIQAIKHQTDFKKITLHSQIHAAGFYEKLGFKRISEEFIEAGIPHLSMELRL